MKLLFIRHGDPDYKNDRLTEVGRREAAMLAERIAPIDVTAYYVSPLGRARETAAPTLTASGRTAVTCDWLREMSIPVHRPDLNGELSHVPWDWLPQDWLSDSRFLDPVLWKENEILRQAGVDRAYDAVICEFDALLADYGYLRDRKRYSVTKQNNATLVFFTHFGLSCVLLSHLMNCSPMILWHGLCMAPSSVTTIHSEERRPGTASFRASAVGDISHLYHNGAEPSFAARFCELYGNGDRVD